MRHVLKRVLFFYSTKKVGQKVGQKNIKTTKNKQDNDVEKYLNSGTLQKIKNDRHIMFGQKSLKMELRGGLEPPAC